MTSLRARAIAGGVVWASVAIVIGVIALAAWLNNQTEERFDDLLRERHTQVVLALVNSGGVPELVQALVANPIYDRPFSGQYWQIEEEGRGVVTSASMVDTLLPLSGDPLSGLLLRSFVAETGEIVRSAGQWITLDSGARFHVQVASSLQTLFTDRERLRNNLTVVFGTLALWGILGTIMLMRSALRPIARLRQDVLERWDDERGLDPSKYPLEVAPLVEDIDTLLERNRSIVDRARRQAADLAHAIKTPSAILRNELEAQRMEGVNVKESLLALDRLDAQLKRSLARIRAEGEAVALRNTTDLGQSLGRLGRAFTALARNSGKHVETNVPDGLCARIDQHDFEEVIGNLVDNALKWSEGQIRISAWPLSRGRLVVMVEDDGPGIPEESRSVVTMGRQRLDASKPGTGLGLAIASDLANAYGGSLELGTSPSLGGLLARLKLERVGRGGEVT